VELPTGSERATSDHVELVPAVFLERKFPPMHVFGLLGGRFAVGDDGDHTVPEPWRMRLRERRR